jgi:hypothetical protein
LGTYWGGGENKIKWRMCVNRETKRRNKNKLFFWPKYIPKTKIEDQGVCLGGGKKSKQIMLMKEHNGKKKNEPFQPP